MKYSREVEKRYQDLLDKLKSHRGDVVRKFHELVGSSLEEYKLLNDPKFFDSNANPDYFSNIPVKVSVAHTARTLDQITWAPRKFFELRPVDLKFLAEKFPIIYLRLFRALADELAFGSVENFSGSKFPEKLHKFTDIPYLKLAYRNTPSKFKRCFDTALLNYYKELKQWSAQDKVK